MTGDCLACNVLFYAVLAFISAIPIYYLRIFIKGKQFEEDVSLEGKVTIVSGATSGIGKRITEDFNKRGAKVYMICRTKEHGDQAVDELVADGCERSRFRVRVVDMEDLESVRKFAHMFRDEEPLLDILVNNAGILGNGTVELTRDGHEKCWQTNYLGHFMLTEFLIAQLRQAKHGARIVNVSSKNYTYSTANEIKEQYINKPVKDSRMALYNRSKFAQVMHARQLTRELAEKNIHNISINACHPGSVHTNILSTTPIAFVGTYLMPLFFYFFKTATDGAQCPIHVALSTKIDGVSGKYFHECEVQEFTSEITDHDEICKDLYDRSKEQIKRKNNEGDN
uniref:Dehydrogenase/reductase SDR family member 13 n=1 Tax=Rhabditophanes sp. KR3021 TaxID=114890 RepID=A0AC35TK02_9BILA